MKLLIPLMSCTVHKINSGFFFFFFFWKWIISWNLTAKVSSLHQRKWFFDIFFLKQHFCEVIMPLWSFHLDLNYNLWLGCVQTKSSAENRKQKSFIRCAEALSFVLTALWCAQGLILLTLEREPDWRCWVRSLQWTEGLWKKRRAEWIQHQNVL